jgi:hypothetical protein
MKSSFAMKDVNKRKTMPDRYQVRFKWGAETKYGEVDSFSDEAKPGELIINDATTAQRYRVKDDNNVVDIPLDWSNRKYNPKTGGMEGGSEYDQHVDAEYKKAKNVSAAAGPGVKVGKLFSTPVGDGCAFYIVTKVNKKTCKVEWRSFQGDRYIDRHFGYGATVPISQVETFIGFEEAMTKAFGK